MFQKTCSGNFTTKIMFQKIFKTTNPEIMFWEFFFKIKGVYLEIKRVHKEKPVNE